MNSCNAAQAIDVHGHFGQYRSDKPGERDRCRTATVEEVARRAERAGIGCTIVSSIEALVPMEQDVRKGNDEARAAAERIPAICFWAVLDPKGTRNWKQTEELLRHPKCKGVKLHPLWHEYCIKDLGGEIFSFCKEHAAAAISHTGDACCDPPDYVPLAEAFPEVAIIMAHLGHSQDDDLFRQVRAIEANTAGNLYTDTSSCRSLYGELLEMAVARIGAEKILFGTDTPLYFAASQKARIEQATIEEDEKRRILGENAGGLLFE